MPEVSHVCHIEFDVTELARSKVFYASLFDWEFREFMDEMVVFGKGEQHIGGLSKVEVVRPASYAVAWFRVESIDATLAATPDAGGQIVSAKKVVPHVGWSATVADPDGNPVGLVEFGPK